MCPSRCMTRPLRPGNRNISITVAARPKLTRHCGPESLPPIAPRTHRSTPLPPAPLQPCFRTCCLTRRRIQALAEEAGRSRLFAGVQFPSDNTAGLELGRMVASRVIEAPEQMVRRRSGPAPFRRAPACGRGPIRGMLRCRTGSRFCCPDRTGSGRLLRPIVNLRK